MIHTAIAYGYDLGGRGSWRLKGFELGTPLRTPWRPLSNNTGGTAGGAASLDATYTCAHRPTSAQRRA